MTLCIPNGFVTYVPAARGKINSSLGGLSVGVFRLPTDPYGNTTVTFQGINADTEIRVYLPDGTEVAGVESCDANHVLTWGVYPSGDPKNTVRITLLLRGYRWQSFQFTATLGAMTIPIFQITDLGYHNPA